MTRLTDKDELKDEKDGINDASRAGLPTGNEAVDPNAAAFHNYLFSGAVALVKMSGMYQSREMQAQQLQQEQTKKDRDARADMLQSVVLDAMIRQNAIDNNIVTLTVNGKKLDISQKDLRKIMGERRSDLIKERDAMIRDGASAEEIDAKNALIDRFSTLEEELKNGKADADTMNNVQNLVRADPDFADRMEQFSNRNSDPSLSKRTSFAAEYFDREGTTPSLMADFNRVQTQTPIADSPDIEKEPHIADKAGVSFSTLGI